MDTEALRPSGDAAPADWLSGEDAAALTVRSPVVGVPGLFARHARVLHPATDATGGRLRWAQVAATTGGRVHPDVQWSALVGLKDRWDRDADRWPFEAPAWGNLDLTDLRALARVLAQHTTTPRRCCFGVWDGWAHLSGPPATTRVVGPPPGSPTRAHDGAPARFRAGGRDHLLFEGPLDAVDELAQYGPGPHDTQSPSLIWPEDHAWLVVTDIDLDSTFVAASAEAVDDLVGCAVLEACPVPSVSSMDLEADHLNRARVPHRS